MLRKVFTRHGRVIAVSEVGSPDADVTFPGATDHHFVFDDAVVVRMGDTLAGAVYSPTPPTVPDKVTMRQARLALLGAGLLATVNASVAAMPGATGDAARIEWEFSSEVYRQKTLVLTLGAALGLTSAQLDSLFIKAETL